MQSATLHRLLPPLALCLIAAQANATEIFAPSVPNTNIINLAAVRIDGTLFSTGFGQAAPFIINAYATAGECLRLDVISQPGDLEMVVVAPDGTVYRVDDRIGSTLPLVQIPSAPSTGWYTVHLSHFAGSPIEGNLTLLYGRYTAGGANCAQATPPLSTASFSAMFEEENAASLKKQVESSKPAPTRGVESQPR